MLCAKNELSLWSLLKCISKPYKRQMNHRIFILSVLLFCLSPILHAQSESIQSSQWNFDCDLGFSYEISKNANWGINEPVVTYVAPGSPAQFAGLKINDIIMQVRCDATYLRDSILIDEWLRKESDVLTNQITIRNLDYYFSEYIFQKTCGSIDRLSEIKLANLFEGYSLEDSRKEIFKMPIHIFPMQIAEHDYSDYHSFDFNESITVSPDLEAYIEKTFNNMGVLRNTKDPDFLVKFNFSVVDKQNAKTISGAKLQDGGCNLNKARYNVLTQDVEVFPIASLDNKDFKQQASINFEFVEKKNIDSTRFTTIWQANIIENFTEKVDTKNYLDVYIPLILMQFPYTKQCNDVTFQANIKQFLYTGIQYDANDMQKIVELDPYGPAYLAGIYLGYKVTKIQDIPLAPSMQMVNQNYASFLKETDSYRSTSCYAVSDPTFPNRSYNEPINPSSLDRYSTLVPAGPNHFWNEGSIGEIQKSFDPKRSSQAFSYLFDFNKFVNPNYDGSLKFEVTNGRTKRTVLVKPELKKMNSLRVIQ